MPEDITKRILDAGVLEVAIENVASYSHDAYALARKDYFGASDSSILCGVNLYKTLDQLIKEKNTKAITAEEKAVGEKPIVKKGYDLEPIILAKAEAELLNMGYKGTLYKPTDMFKFKNVDGLSVNYDGVFHVTLADLFNFKDDVLFPVEAKLVSKYGEKYYNKTITPGQAKRIEMDIEGDSLEQHIKRKATKFGIPAYYYTQVQQEIAGTDAPYGFLAAMFDDSWSFHLFFIQRDDYVINSIYDRCSTNIVKILR